MDTYQSILHNIVNLDLAGIIVFIPAYTAYKLSNVCPPRSTRLPPCYMGIGMIYYILESERFPQWKAEAYLIRNGYSFFVENARTKAWLSIIPNSKPGTLCKIDVREHTNIDDTHLLITSIIAVLSYFIPTVALLPGAVLGGPAGIVVAVSAVCSGIIGTCYTYCKDKSEWTGTTKDETIMRLLVFLPGDRWYLIKGKNKNIKKVTAGSAICGDTLITFILQWAFKVSITVTVLSATNTVFMVQLGLIIAYILSTVIIEFMVYYNIYIAKKVIINNTVCKYTTFHHYDSKQSMLDSVEEEGEGMEEMVNWRQHFKLS